MSELLNIEIDEKNNLEISKDKLLETATYFKMHINTQFNMLLSVSGVDKTDCFEVIYHLFSSVFNKKLLLKVKLEKNNPNIDSLSRINSA